MPYLDGLRAFAVIIVLIFHLNPDWLSGGFIGVDIFFVLSGFLISQLIALKLKKNEFNYSSFLLSRFKRLAPAYLTLLIITSISAVFFLLPKELLLYSKNVEFSLLFLSNFHFYALSDYFAPSSKSFPLLHTWSLAVEWQFYLIFPLLLLYLWRCFKSLPIYIYCAALALSLITTILITYWNISFSFYMLPSRAFELLIGGFVGLYGHNSIKQKSILLYVSLIALIILIFCMIYFDHDLAFPGIYAVIVSSSTALLIYAFINYPESALAKFFSYQWLRFIGKISYSLYLWHWPIFLYASWYWQGTEYTINKYILTLFITLIFSLFSYYLIENKFRKHKSNKPVLSLSVIVIISIIITSSIYQISNGLPDRFKEYTKIINTPKWQKMPGKCSRTQNSHGYYYCVLGDQSEEPYTLIWGDSHAQALSWQIDKHAKNNQQAVLFLTKGGCPPIFFGLPSNSPINALECIESQKLALEIIKNKPIKQILISARWHGYKKKSFGQKPVDTIPEVNNQLKHNNEFINRVETTLNYLSKLGKNIIILDSIPEPPYSVPEFLARKAILSQTLPQDFKLKEYESLSDLLFNKKLNVVNVRSTFCNNNNCKLQENGYPVYFDTNHLSIYGSEKLQPIFDKYIFNK
jgi:peptidoglycan/LPS O-acetylase OafA/YrhL